MILPVLLGAHACSCVYEPVAYTKVIVVWVAVSGVSRGLLVVLV